jgi:hypothetical protein
MDNRDERYEQARARVHKLRGFYIHLLVYGLVNVGLIALNLVAGRPFWFIWPLLGWGIGVIAHGLSVAGTGVLGREWEERKTREYLERERK